MRRFHKTCAGLLCLLLAVSMLLGGTLAWQSLDQTARNDLRVEKTREDEPVLEKVVEGLGAPKKRFEFLLRALDGAPLPDGQTGDTLCFFLDGGGSVKLGKFRFTQAGTYRYEVTEVAGSGAGWTFDPARYILTFTVTESDGTLVVERDLTKDGGETANRLVFRNKYIAPDPVDPPDPPDNKVTISGTKTWVHGSNPPENWPESVVIYVYADGELVHQQLVTASEKWAYTFRLPRYAKGKKVTYTVGEKEVPGYSAQIDGYDIVNTFIEPEPTPTPTETPPAEPTPTPEGSIPPTPTPPLPPIPTPPPSTVVKTGDTGELTFWFAILVTGVVGMALCLGYLCFGRHRYVGKRLKP